MTPGLLPIFYVCLMFTFAYLLVTSIGLVATDQREEKVMRTLATFYGMEITNAEAKALVSGGTAIIALNGRMEIIRLAESAPDDIRFRRGSGALLQPPL